MRYFVSKKDLSLPIDEGRLNEVRVLEIRRKNGSLRVQSDYQFCPTMCEQHTAHLSDLNYLMEKYQPDELAAYLAARTAHRREILGHDFSVEPSLQEAMNITYRVRQAFENLDEDVRKHFRNHVEFLKFIDNPANEEKLVKLGLLTKKEVAEFKDPVATTTTQEAKEPKETSKPPSDSSSPGSTKS